MSFLLIFNKKSSDLKINETSLARKLCPYNRTLLVHRLTESGILFYNDFSQLKDSVFLSPKNHNCEKNSAWIKIEIKDLQLNLQTDPLGQCPVWILQNDQILAVSPELKALAEVKSCPLLWRPEDYYLVPQARQPNESDFQNIQKLDPGSKLNIDLKSFAFTVKKIKLPWETFSPDPSINLQQAQENLHQALLQSISEIPDGVASLLSGGIDSSVATALAKQKKIQNTYNLATEFGSEEKQSARTSDYLNLKSHVVKLASDQALTDFYQTVFQNELTDGLTAEILFQLKILLQGVPEKNIVTGYGADLLFGGMLKHEVYMQVTAVHDTTSLLHRTQWSKEFSPFYYWALGKRLYHIYWHPEVIRCALSLPDSLQAGEKHVLRSMAVRFRLLSQDLAFLPKQGMTNGTHANTVLSNLLKLKDENSYVDKDKIVLKQFKEIFK